MPRLSKRPTPLVASDGSHLSPAQETRPSPGPLMGCTSAQPVQQRLGLLQVRGVESLGEPAVDLCQEMPDGCVLALARLEAAQGHRRPQRPRSRTRATGLIEAPDTTGLGLQMRRWRPRHRSLPWEPKSLCLLVLLPWGLAMAQLSSKTPPACQPVPHEDRSSSAPWRLLSQAQKSGHRACRRVSHAAKLGEHVRPVDRTPRYGRGSQRRGIPAHDASARRRTPGLSVPLVPAPACSPGAAGGAWPARRHMRA